MMKISLKMLFLFTLLSSFYQSICWSVDSLKFADLNTPLVTAGTSTNTFTLRIDIPASGGGTSSSQPYNLFVPMHSSSGGVDNADYSTVTSTILPEYGDGFQINFNLFYTKTTADDKTLYAAVRKINGRYEVFLDSNPLNTGTGSTYWVPSLSIDTICLKSGDLSNCNTLTATSNPNTTAYTTLFFFMGPPDLEGTEIDATRTDVEGFYVKLNLSNKVYSGYAIILEDLLRGDGQLVARYTGFTMNEVYKVYAFEYNTPAPPTNKLYSSIRSSGSLRDVNTTMKTGDIPIRELQNGVTYTFSMLYVDKYQFASIASNELSKEPLEIEALLESQTCFLLTAGFEGEHPIVNYFRYIRDSYLAHSIIGRLFIGWYYETAPAWALTIYKSAWLKQIIRSSAWVLYWNFQLYFAPVLVLLGLGGLLLRRRSKINKNWSY